MLVSPLHVWSHLWFPNKLIWPSLLRGTRQLIVCMSVCLPADLKSFGLQPTIHNHCLTCLSFDAEQEGSTFIFRSNFDSHSPYVLPLTTSTSVYFKQQQNWITIGFAFKQMKCILFASVTSYFCLFRLRTDCNSGKRSQHIQGPHICMCEYSLKIGWEIQNHENCSSCVSLCCLLFLACLISGE